MFSTLKLIRNEIWGAKQFAFTSNNNPFFGFDCWSHFCRSNRSRHFKSLNFRRHLNSHNAGKKKFNYLPLIVGSAVVGGVGSFVYSRFSSKPSTELIDILDDEFNVPFVYETLEEDIKLLNNFGPVPYLLVGAGNASFAAFRAIRVNDPTAKVLMIGDEPFYPYMRPPLSKEMWFEKKEDVAYTLSFTQWSGKERSVFYEPEEYYFSVKEMLENKNGGVSVIRGKKVVKVDPVAQSVFLDSGEEIRYQKCLIATGAKPKNLPVFELADKDTKKHITLFRTARDFQKLDKISRNAKSIVIVGGGFLGSELAYGLARRISDTGLKITQLFPESGNLGMVLPEYLSKSVANKVEAIGVTVKPNTTVTRVSKKDGMIELCLSNDEVLAADHVVVAVGVDPNTEIAHTSGLEVDEKHGGFLVNTEMEARKNLWIAGDVSCFYDAKLGRRRVEHHDHAVVSGRLAGENMTGNGKPYSHQSMVWSDLGPEIGFEAVGIIDSKLPTVGVFAKPTQNVVEKSDINGTGENKTSSEENGNLNSIEQETVLVSKSDEDYGKGVIFYLRDNVIVGILLWNLFTKMSVARKIINESKSYDDLVEVAKLFDLHSTEE